MFKFFKEKIQELLGKKQETEEKAEEIKKIKPVKKDKKEKLPIEKTKIKQKVSKIEIPHEKDFLPKEKKPKIDEKTVEENKQEVEYIIDQTEEKAEEIKEPETTEHEGFFTKFKKKFTTIKLDQETFNEFFEKLEMLLLENNVALEVVDKIRDDMEKKLVNIEVKKDQLENEIKNSLKEYILEILIPPFSLIDEIKKK